MTSDFDTLRLATEQRERIALLEERLADVREVCCEAWDEGWGGSKVVTALRAILDAPLSAASPLARDGG